MSIWNQKNEINFETSLIGSILRKVMFKAAIEGYQVSKLNESLELILF